jgi:phosphoribosylaminoimidazolecarboxamide formyltransferase/IMP cyclohydrolase
MSIVKIKRALISVSDKKDIETIGAFLESNGVEILSTGGTAKLLKEKGVAVKSVDSYTGHPEIMNGRVKTLHPKIHGGILAVRDNENHMKDMKDNGIEEIDLVVVNLYPFRETIAKEGVTLEDAIENIDIGGPTMVRSSAKNHKYVTIVVDPSDYPLIIKEIEDKGGVTQETRNKFAAKAFAHTASYDAAITDYLSQQYK